jgi:hypothetical protein
MARKPRPEDFKIGQPISNDERINALNHIIRERVLADRKAAYKDARARWDWKNIATR